MREKKKEKPDFYNSALGGELIVVLAILVALVVLYVLISGIRLFFGLLG